MKTLNASGINSTAAPTVALLEHQQQFEKDIEFSAALLLLVRLMKKYAPPPVGEELLRKSTGPPK